MRIRTSPFGYPKGKKHLERREREKGSVRDMSLKKRLSCAALCLGLLLELLPATALAKAPGTTKVDEKIYGTSIAAWLMGFGYDFEIRGIDGTKTYLATDNIVEGFNTVVSVDDGPAELALSQVLFNNVNLYVDLERYDDHYILAQYTIKNSSSKSHKIQIGSYSHTRLDSNECPSIMAEEAGGKTLRVSGNPANDYVLKLVATSCDTLWYGSFSHLYDNSGCFLDLPDRGPDNVYDRYGGIAYSWTATIDPGETWTRCVLIGLGSEEEMQGETPALPASEDIIPDPSIRLTTDEIYLTEGDTLPDWRSFIASAVRRTHISNTLVNTKTPGTYTVTYTAYVTAPYEKTATATLKVHILPKPAELSQTTVTGTSSFTLSATMNRTGGLTWTETGFVYGLIASPTLTQNEGTVKTSSAVSSENGKLTVTVAKSRLVEGLRYYARAYAKASDGTVIYGASSSAFGVNAPKNGTFSVTNNDSNTFTISRAGGTDGQQTVYYRTVNGSAVGDTHFTHKAGSLTFAAGEATKTVTVTEKTANTSYGSKTATAYSNADRTYQLEIYRVEGGASIGTSRATRTMTKNSSYTIDRSTYRTEKSIVNLEKTSSGKYGKKIADATKAQGGKDNNVNFVLNRDKSTNYTNYSTSTSLSDYYSGNLLSYLKNTCANWLYRYEMYAYEEKDGYEHAYIGTKALENKFYDLGEKGHAVTGIDGQLWAGTFQQGQGDIHRLYKFPAFDTGGGENSGRTYDHSGTGLWTKNREYDGVLSVAPGINDTCYLHFSAGGADEDIWWINGLTSYAIPYDTQEPQLLALAPMAGGKYLPGDSVTISLIFDEIVDSTYSSLNSGTTISTNWGTFKYAGGADTNVLYFTGTVPENPSNTIKLTDLTCAAQIKDMSNDTGKSTSYSGTPSATVTVSTATSPTVSVGAISNSCGALSSTITATNAVKLEYAWSIYKTLPTSGWTTSSSTTSVTAKTARTAGTYYLHARATNSDGRVVTAYRSVTVSSSGPNASANLVEMSVSVDNTTWAKEKTITITRWPTSANVTVKQPDGSSTVRGSGNSYIHHTATTNGVYTFSMKVNGETMTRQAVVSKIDTTAPTITINDLPDSRYTERMTLTFSVVDSASGVNTVTAKWGNASTTVTKNSDGTYSVTCPNTTGTYQLTVTATDNVGNSTSAVSKSYTIDLDAPTLTVTQQSSTSRGVTYAYSVEPNDNTDISVHLPNGTLTTDLSGTFTLTEAGDYLVSLTDAAGHFVSQVVKVTQAVDGVAPEVRLYVRYPRPASSLTVEVWVFEAGSTPTVWLNGSALTMMTSEEDGLYTGSFTITSGGIDTVTATDAAGNTGRASVTSYILIDRAATLINCAELDEARTDTIYGALPQPASENTGHTFKGWYTAETGGTKAENSTPVGTNYTLYARWTANTYTVTLDAGGGIVQPDSMTVTYGEPYGTLPTPTRSGYAFEGWFTQQSGGTQVKAATKVTDAKDHTLYARWAADTVTITWGTLAFTYSDGTWHPETHTYEGVGWTPDVTGGNRITVKNEGVNQVAVSFRYTQSNYSVAGSITDETGAPVTAVTLPSGANRNVLVTLAGKPTASLSNATIGTVTVQLGGNE